MRIRKEYLILLVLLIGLSVYIWQHQADEVNYNLPEPPLLNTEEITRIQINNSEGSMVLKKREDSWFFEQTGHKASGQEIKEMLPLICDLQLTALVSTSKNYSRYSLDKEQRIRVKAWKDEDLVRSLFIGKTGANYSSTYVKFPQDPNIYMARKNLKIKFAKGKNALRDKTVLSFSRENVQKIELSKDELDLALVKEPGSRNNQNSTEQSGSKPIWKSTSGRKVATAEIDKLLKHLDQLKCSQFISSEPKDPAKPLYTVTLTGDEQYSLSMYSPDKKDEEYIVSSSDSEDLFTLSTYTQDKITKVIDKLLQVETAKSEEGDR